jgi:hypothetical protein
LSRGIFAFAGLFLLGVPSHPSWCPLRGLPPDCSYIVPHLEWFVKGFFIFFFDDWNLPSVSAGLSYHRTQCRGPLGRGALYLPLTSLVYHRPHDLSSVLGKIIFLFFFDFSLDKLLNLWYNGNIARLGRGRATENTK